MIPSPRARLTFAARVIGLALATLCSLSAAQPGKAAAKTTPAATATSPIVPNSTGLDFIDTSFENASPLWYEQAADGTIVVHLLYDHERSSPNRAAGHIHFMLQGKPGAKLTIEITNLDNVWNGVRGSVSRELKTVCLSENGRDWRVVPVDNSSGSTGRFTVEMPGPRLYVARIEPYRISDLNTLLAAIRPHPLAQITPIGHTVQGRELEIVRIGSATAPYRVFLRARAHPWEPGGNWVVQGLIQRLLRGDAAAARFLERTCYYILPMANKDGVAHGRTRFNFQGKDLNRDWDKPVVKDLAPENYALEQWLEKMIATGQAPHFAMELHNDGGGRLHISRPPIPNLARHLERMAIFERILRQRTWFTEGPTNTAFRNSGTLGDGWLQRYGIDAVVHEFNANWIEGLKEPPQGKHWINYGENLVEVFHEYFAEVKP